jgi:hypothetical protein
MSVLHLGQFDIAPIKVIFTIFVIFAWSRAFLKFRNKSMNAKEIVFWTILWVSITVAIFIPGKTTVLAHLLGMDRGFDAMILIAVIALFYAVYRLYTKANENEQVITELVRQIALKDGTSKKRKK